MSQVFLQSVLLGVGVMMAVLAARHGLSRQAGARARALNPRQPLRCVEPLQRERHR
jgi:hypothetical protein